MGAISGLDIPNRLSKFESPKVWWLVADEDKTVGCVNSSFLRLAQAVDFWLLADISALAPVLTPYMRLQNEQVSGCSVGDVHQLPVSLLGDVKWGLHSNHSPCSPFIHGPLSPSCKLLLQC